MGWENLYHEGTVQVRDTPGAQTRKWSGKSLKHIETNKILSFRQYSWNQNNQVETLDIACVSKSLEVHSYSYLVSKRTTVSSWECYSSDKFYEPKSLAHNFMMKRVLHGFTGIPCATNVECASALTPQPSTCTTSALLPVSVSWKAIARVVFQTQTNACNAFNLISLSRNKWDEP